MKEFKFSSTVEEIKVNGRIYGIDFSDEKVREYQKKLEKFYLESEEVRTANVDNLSQEDQDKLLRKTHEMAKEVIEMLLGKNTYETLYHDSGKSLFNMVELLNFLTKVVDEKSSNLRSEKFDKYIKNKKNKQKQNKK